MSQKPHDSTNHTFVNTTRVESADLRDGDKIQIGDSVLKFVLLDDIEARFHEEIRNRTCVETED